MYLSNYLCITACVCNPLGVDRTGGECDRYTGQCPCLPNVIGLQCGQCAANHWKLASGYGCEPCGCDRQGSSSQQCNEVCTCISNNFYLYCLYLHVS